MRTPFGLGAAIGLAVVAFSVPADAKPSFEQTRAAYLEARKEGPDRAAGAARGFIRFKTEECARYVAAQFKREKHKNLRLALLDALGRIGKAPATEVLKGALKGSPEDREGAMSGLASLKPEGYEQILIGVLEDTKNPTEVLKRAAKEVSVFPTEATVLALARTLAGKPALEVELMCQDSLRTVLERTPKLGTYLLSTAAKDKALGKAVPALLPLIPVDAPGADAPLTTLLESDEPRARAAAAVAVGERLEGKGSLDACPKLKELLDDPVEGVRAAAAQAIQSIGAAAEVLDKLLKMTKAKDTGERTLSMAALVGCSDPAAIEAAVDAIKGRSPLPVKATAVRVLANSKDKGAITKLIEFLKKNDKGGRLKLDIITALRRALHVDAGMSAKDWQTWWEEQKPGFTFDKRVVTGSAAPAPKHVGGSKTRKPKGPTYYGSEVLSNRIAFVCDISGSMTNPSGTNSTRLRVLQGQLEQVIKQLPGKTKFNVYTFGTDWKSWQKKLVKANGKNKKAAIEFVRALKPSGQTNLYDPLEAALNDPDVDTVYLLSDGAPNRGQFKGEVTIMKAVGRINAKRRTVIHTISLAGESKLLRKLAEANGGEIVIR